MQGDAGDGGNGRKPGALLRRATHGIEDWTDRTAVIGVIDEAADLQQRATRRLRILDRQVQAPESPDEYIGIKEVADLIKRSVSWIRHQPPEAIPGRRQLCEGGRVDWSRRAVLRFREASTLQGP